MKRKPSIGVRDRADDRQPGMPVEQVVTNNKRRPPVVAGTRITVELILEKNTVAASHSYPVKER